MKILTKVSYESFPVCLFVCVRKEIATYFIYLFSDLSDTNTDILKSMQRFISEEDEIKEATKIASTFVAGIMATAVADYIKVIYDDNHESHRLVSAAQVPISIRLTSLIILCLLVGWLHALKGSLGSRHSATPDVSFKCAHVQCELFRRNNYWDHSIVVDQKSQWSIRMISFRRVFFRWLRPKLRPRQLRLRRRERLMPRPTLSWRQRGP